MDLGIGDIRGEHGHFETPLKRAQAWQARYIRTRSALTLTNLAAFSCQSRQVFAGMVPSEGHSTVRLRNTPR